MSSPIENVTGSTPLELFKHCPQCGKNSFRLRERNELYCQACGFVFYHNPPVSVVALLTNDQNQVLLTQRKFPPAAGKFDFPGGFVDTGENLESALKREIREELNLEISELRYLDSVVTTYPFKGITYYPVDTIFRCRVQNWNALQVRDDVQAICFKHPEAITDAELAFDSHRLLLKKIILIQINKQGDY